MQLTDYLFEHSGATVEQIDDLLSMAQLGSRSLLDQAYLSGLLDEHELLKAIRQSTDLPTVELKGRKIDSSILRLMAGRQAWSLKLLPFALEEGENILSLAYRFSGDNDLAKTASSIFPDHEIKLFAAIGPLLDAAIMEHYRSEPLSDSNSAMECSKTDNSEKSEVQSKVAYLVGARTEADRYLGRALAVDGYQVIMADDWSELVEELSSSPPDLVLIRESTDAADGPDLTIAAPPDLPASTVLRRYQSVSCLLDPSQDLIEHGSLAVANLHLATEALARTLHENIELPVQIGLMVEKVCQQLRLTPHDHLITVTAGYLQDIAALYFKEEGPSDRQTAYFMLQGLIDESVLFPPPVLGVIRKMYSDLTMLKPPEVNTSETRNGNILTLVDFYMRQFPDQAKITPRRFDLIDQKVRDQIGRLFLPEVAEGLLSLLQSGVSRMGREGSTNSALVLDELGIIDDGLAEILSATNYALSLTNSIEQFTARYQKRPPDLIIITSGASAVEIESTFQRLLSEGVVFGSVPSFLIHASTDFDQIAKLAKYGLSQAIHYLGEFEILNLRLKQVVEDKEQESRKRLQVLQEMGTHGSLMHMNIIDLLQSMGPSNKTLCIGVTAKGHHLAMYLSQGQLVHAASDELIGVDAVYEALKWDNGIWSVDHITLADMPEPNVHSSIDSILMRGCYLLDELNRSQSESAEIATNS